MVVARRLLAFFRCLELSSATLSVRVPVMAGP